MNQKINELMERMVIKMLEEDLKNNESIITSQDGTTTISMKQNNLVSLLMYLQLTSEKNDRQVQKGIESEVKTPSTNKKKEAQLIEDDFDEREKEELLEKITILEKRNEQFKEEITKLFHESDET